MRLLGKHEARKGNAEAYRLYLQGRYFADRRNREDLARAISYYRRALKLDPRDPRTWVGLALAHDDQAGWSYIPLEEGYRMARQEVEKAIELDPNLAEAHAALGRIRKYYDWDFSGADAAFKRALELEPGNATVVRGAAALAGTLGRFDEAIALGWRAVELDPLSAAIRDSLGGHAWRAGRLDVAEAAFGKALELQPDYPGTHMRIGRVRITRSKSAAALDEMVQEKEPFFRRYGLALAYHALGRTKEADACLGELLEKDREDSAYQIAEVLAFRGKVDEAFAWLERAYAQRDPGIPEMMIGDPLLESLEADARHRAFLERMRLPLPLSPQHHGMRNE